MQQHKSKYDTIDENNINEIVIANLVNLKNIIISMFYGIIISMYYFDNRKHKLAHIHVKYQGEQAIFTIPDGKMLEGNYENK